MNLSEWRIPLSHLDYDGEEEAAASRVLRSRWLSMGAEVEAFEQEFADLTGSDYAIAVANGTAALHLAYLALNLGPGDEIIQPAINFVAAANMTVAIGARPLFADIRAIEYPVIDPEEMTYLVSPQTKAVLVMHYGGYLPRMSEILKICQQHGLFLIEDACHAVGASCLDSAQKSPHGKKAGNLGDVACFSFFSNKNMAVGEGGMITTNREDVAQRVRSLRSHGMTTMTWDRHRGHAHSYDVIAHGYNYRLDEIHAALGRAQLRKLACNNERRQRLVAEYKHRLDGLPGWVFPFADYQGNSSYHLAVVVAPDADSRTRVTEALRNAGIQTSLHYPCLPEFKAFERFRSDDLTRSRGYAGRAITLPLFPSLTLAQVEEVCTLIRKNA